MKVTYDVEFRTAFDGCNENCRSFEAEVDKYTIDSEIFKVVCTCRNIELCEHLADYIKEIMEVD